MRGTQLPLFAYSEVNSEYTIGNENEVPVAFPKRGRWSGREGAVREKNRERGLTNGFCWEYDGRRL